MPGKHAHPLLALALAAWQPACLFTDPINLPTNPGQEDPIFGRLGACTPHASDPVVLEGPGSRVEFRCHVEDVKEVRWSLFVDGQERVVWIADSADASSYTLSWDRLPRPLPETLSLHVEGTGIDGTTPGAHWPVVVRR